MTNINNPNSKTILLHKDEHMKRMQEASNSHPVQLDLFQTLVSNNYSNSVELYQTLPDVFS